MTKLEMEIKIHNMGIEIGCHNILYEDHAYPVISDQEYDKLNNEYFALCEEHSIKPNECLNEDSGMMNPGNLTKRLKSFSKKRLIEDAIMLRADRIDAPRKLEWARVLKLTEDM